MGNRRVLAFTLCAVACGANPAPRPAAPPPRARITKEYPPLAMKADAKLPGQAVILGTDGDRATVLPLPAGPTTGVVDALFLAGGNAGPATAATVAVTLTTSSTAPVFLPATPGQGPSGPASGASPVGASPSAASPPATAPSATAPPAASPPATAPSATAPSATAPSATAPALPSAAGVATVGPIEAGDPAAWQAGLWSAAMVAAAALGKDVGDFAFSATPAVPGEHPGASALVAAGFVAAMMGEKIDPGATLAGVIFPDGTIGPVAGLPEQLVAAAGRGKTRIGYPSGMRMARSLATGKEVDLVRLAREHRAEAVEVGSVQEAVALLVRAPMPATAPVDEAEMAVDGEMLDKLEARYLAWRKRLADEWAELLQLEQSGRLPSRVKQLVRLAHERSEQAEALHRAAKLPAAYRRMATAWVSAAAANGAYKVVARLATGDADGAAAALSATGASEASTGALLAKIGGLQPSTLAGHLAMVAAFQAALRGWAYDAFAADSVRTTTQLLGSLKGRPVSELASQATMEGVANAVVPAALLRFRAIVENEMADGALEGDQGVAYACSPRDVMRIASVYRSAAAAGLRHVDGLLVDPLTHRTSITAAAVRERVASEEPDYLVADMLTRMGADGLPHDFAASWGERSVSATLLELAVHELAYHQTAVLIARYDALPGRVYATGRIDVAAHPAALRAMLASAARAARAHARAARLATGAIPLQARLAYQLAAAAATGPVAEQLEALAGMWTSSAFSQLAVMLARN
jgi:hypothetical protein